MCLLGWTSPGILPCAQAPLQLVEGAILFEFLSNRALARQDVKLQPLSSFLQPFWNELNALPIDLWLINTATEEMDHRQRMKCLGNLVVPAQGALAMDILQRMRLEPNSLCAA